MTSNYDDFHEYSNINDSEPDHFELLSAYIDDEVTPQERKQVQEWLDNDPSIKQLYLQLLSLQTGMQSLSVPSPPEISAEILSENVFATIDRTRNRKKLLLWSGGAIAATIVATVSGLFPGVNSPSLRLAESVNQETAEEETVLVAITLHQPAIKIPKPAGDSPAFFEEF
ncbi:MAG: zf-HC2 domain-containing protein [Xenococcaceae cyanobacterium MO_207.B15]|nr:zf-HC2 domain-containing protein [Xenococcaceae cyanobacterium MO_207.B15]